MSKSFTFVASYHLSVITLRFILASHEFTTTRWVIQKVEETVNFRIFDLIWIIFIKFLCNSSFAGSMGLIIVSSRSGACFSSCLRSSIYISISKTCLFLRINFLFVPSSPDVQPLQPISGPCSIEKYPSSWMANRYTRIFDAGWWLTSRLTSTHSDWVLQRTTVSDSAKV